MPVCLDRKSCQELLKRPEVVCKTAVDGFSESEVRCLDIGLINNMPDGALQSTERQFISLLDSAADGILVRLSIFGLPDVPRTDVGRRHVATYGGLESLLESRLDGLIVTGAEPRTQNLKDEPYWQNMTRVLEWAEHNTHSSVWSCLAAHAAVLHSDGIVRRRLSEKRCGVFQCSPATVHPLICRMASDVHIPHSRWNEISEPDLADCGYTILTRADGAGVDTFSKQKNSLFIYFQGHPEYDTNSLLLEYRRDIGRYLRREIGTYPQMPAGYFDTDTSFEMLALQERARSARCQELLADFPTAATQRKLVNSWRPSAVRLYENWLVHLREQKQKRLRERPGRRRFNSPATEHRLVRRAAASGNEFNN